MIRQYSVVPYQQCMIFMQKAQFFCVFTK